MGSEGACIPKLDFSHLEPGQVMRALESYGCFEVAYDEYTTELRDELFGRAWPELFSLPLEVKMRNKTDQISKGYTPQKPGWPHEFMIIPSDVEEFARTFWPQGNHAFCDTVSSFSKHMKDLEQIIVRMLFLSLGLEEYHDSYTKSRVCTTQLAQYGTPLGQSKIGISSHVDNTIISIICQQREGLEIQNKGGEWIPVVPSPNSFTVLIGEIIQVWTNGRVQAPFHRVRITGNEKRYSAIFASVPNEDFIVQTPEELVDEEHPLIYKPFVFKDYSLFRYSDGGARISNTLYDFGGIREEEQNP